MDHSTVERVTHYSTATTTPRWHGCNTTATDHIWHQPTPAIWKEIATPVMPVRIADASLKHCVLKYKLTCTTPDVQNRKYRSVHRATFPPSRTRMFLECFPFPQSRRLNSFPMEIYRNHVAYMLASQSVTWSLSFPTNLCPNFMTHWYSYYSRPGYDPM